jgi:hypothetical protein
MLDLPDMSRSSLWVFAAGGLLAGLLGLLACRQQRPSPTAPGLAPALLALAALGAGAAATGRLSLLGWPALALAGVLLLFKLARSDRLANFVAAVFTRARRPRWQWAALALGCPATAALFALGPPRQGLELPPLRGLPFGTAVTDLGHDVPVGEVGGGLSPDAISRTAVVRELRERWLADRVIQTAPADWSYNCHGWVFAAGRYVLADDVVPLILHDNGYRPVVRPAVGDLVVYRDEHSAVCHTAQVWAVGEGDQVLVESKWAWLGRYLHAPGATPYGQDWGYYRSPRSGHELRFSSLPSRPSLRSPLTARK